MPVPPVSFGPFLFNPENGTLFRDGELIAVGQRGALLLRALLKGAGQVVTKAELMDAAWPGMAVEESNLSVQIASLRKLLGPSPDGAEWIATIPRIGYRFFAEPQRATPAPIPAALLATVIPSLAVLPFHNLSGDPEQEYFADGVVEDMITALSRFKSFAVIARNSSFVYKGRAVDVRQVAKELGVRYVLEGSVRRAGSRLRISAQLVDGTSGAHLWAKQFDGATEDVFEFQDRITESVVAVVEPQVRQAEIERARRERPTSLAAYDLYLRALPMSLPTTLHENAEAYALISKVIALEPANSTYLATAALLLHLRAIMGWPAIGHDDRERCLHLVDRALANARDDATALAYCGISLFQFIKDYDRGLALVRCAVEANPNNLFVVACAGVANLHCGMTEDALTFFHRAIRLSPLDPRAYIQLTGIAHVHMILGNYREAIDWASQSLALNPDYNPTYWILIAAQAHLGHLHDAHLFLEKFRALAPGVTISGIRAGQPQKDPVSTRAILEGLRLAGLAQG